MLLQVPRGKWQCPGCNQKGHKNKNSKSRNKKGTPTHLLHNADSESESPEQTNQNSPEQDQSEQSRASLEDSNDQPPAASTAPASPSNNGKSEKIKESSKENSLNRSVTPTPAPTPTPPPATVAPPSGGNRNSSSSSKKSKSKLSKMDKDVTVCHTVISEMLGMENAWPFVKPVNPKAFPTYKKIIKQPMDLTTIKKKLESGNMKTREDFISSVNLIFENCELFNEDESPVGIAGYAMKEHFEARWAELTN